MYDPVVNNLVSYYSHPDLKSRVDDKLTAALGQIPSKSRSEVESADTSSQDSDTSEEESPKPTKQHHRSTRGAAASPMAVTAKAGTSKATALKSSTPKATTPKAASNVKGRSRSVQDDISLIFDDEGKPTKKRGGAGMIKKQRII